MKNLSPPPSSLRNHVDTLAAILGIFLVSVGPVLGEEGPDDPLVAALLAQLPIDYGTETEAAGRMMAALFERDPGLALETLRRLHAGQGPALAAADPDSDSARRFDSRRGGMLDFLFSETGNRLSDDRLRLELLSRTLRDEFLSRELTWDFAFLTRASGAEGWGAPLYEKFPPEERIRAIRDDRVARLFLAAPDDFPRILLLPHIVLGLQMIQLADAVSLGSGAYWRLPDPGTPSPLRESRLASLLPPIWEPSPRLPEIPARMKALRHPANQLAAFFWKDEPGWIAPDLEPVLAPLLDEVDASALPANARLALASPAIHHCGWHLPASAATRFAGWLAEAWEDHAAVHFMREEAILEHFTYAGETPDRAAVIDRLLAAWETREQRLDAAYDLLESAEPRDGSLDQPAITWLAALAMEAGRREAKGRLLDSLADSWSDHLFAILVRGGEFERARELLAEHESSFFRVKSRTAPPAWFDTSLQENLRAFADSLPEAAGLRYLVKLRLAALPDLPSAKLETPQRARMIRLARDFHADSFQTARAMEAALLSLARQPEAAALVSERFVSFARVNEVAAHHRSFRADAWSELAGHTLTALLEANEYDQALALLKEIDRHTPPGNVYQRRYQRTWWELASSLKDHLKRHEEELPAVAGVRPVLVSFFARPMETLPESEFHDERGPIMRRLLDLDLALGSESDWWQWRSTLDPELRRGLDHGMLDSRRDPPPPRDARTEESARLALVEVFDAVPPARPLAEKAAALLDFLRSDEAHGADGGKLLQHFAHIVETYRYLTPAELLSLAPEIAKALDHHPTICYAAARLAHEAGDTDLSRQWLARAHRAFAEERASEDERADSGAN